MPMIAIYVVAALAVLLGGYFGKSMLKEQGAMEERAKTEAASKQAQLVAHEYRIRAMQAIETVEREKAAEIAVKKIELGGLRDERAGDADGDRIVFDERWANWVRGARGKPGDRPGDDQVARDSGRRNR